MTVHGSKGLEFKVVHLPMLGAGMFPLRWQGERCPAPDGLLPTSAEDDHEEEEECLFYVALSRARDHLSLSRAERYSEKQGSNPSKSLLVIAGRLPRAPDGPANWTQPLALPPPMNERPDLRIDGLEHDGRDIELYLGCPRQYLYQLVLGLSGAREDAAYVRFHRAVYRVLNWMREQSGSIEAAAIADELEAAWNDIGPHDDPLAPLFRASAVGILDQTRTRPKDGIEFVRAIGLQLGSHTVNLSIDEIEQTGGHIVVRRIRTGRPPSKPDQRHLHALMLKAARLQMGSKARFEVQYLTTNEPVPVTLDRVMADRLDDVQEALDGLAKGTYPAKPKNAEDCPRCPHYFICPSVPADE
jgi:hypothetical protein